MMKQNEIGVCQRLIPSWLDEWLCYNESKTEYSACSIYQHEPLSKKCSVISDEDSN